MTGGDDPSGPVEQRPDGDWRRELHWSRIRRLILLHGIYWGFGAAQAMLYGGGLLAGIPRVVSGVVDYLAWATLLVLSFRILVRPGRGPGSGRLAVSGRTFLILVAFLASLAAFLVLLARIGLGTITVP